MAYPPLKAASFWLQIVLWASWDGKEHFIQRMHLDWRPSLWCIRGVYVQFPKKEIQRVANNSRTRHPTRNFSKCFWSVLRSSSMSERLVFILQHSVGRGPLYCKNRQKARFLNGFSVDFHQINTSRIPIFAKEMDTESYRRIWGQKISNAILWAPVFTPLAERPLFPFREAISYYMKKTRSV